MPLHALILPCSPDKTGTPRAARLRLLLELLADEGLIFVTIDNNEQHHLRCLLDEVFGESGFIAEIAWQKSYSPSNDAVGIDALHDTIFVYSKIEKPKMSLLERTEKQDAAYENADNDPRGLWKPGDSTRPEHRELRNGEEWVRG